jgi:uncharacterized protein YjiS (DUF1127 family)
MSHTQYHLSIGATESWQPPRARPAAQRPAFATVIGLLRVWRQRQRERRELSLMSGQDFGDLAIPPSLVTEEVRRWPWQKSSPQWSEVATGREQFADRG